jgi:hypothetical protein
MAAIDAFELSKYFPITSEELFELVGKANFNSGEINYREMFLKIDEQPRSQITLLQLKELIKFS